MPSNREQARIEAHGSQLSLWGISATIGNLEEAKEVLLSPLRQKGVIVSAILKNIEIESIIPDEIEKYPWAGHLGIKLVDKVIPIIEKSRTTLSLSIPVA